MGEKPWYSPANPTPEIMPDEVKAVRPDAITATGRSVSAIRSTTSFAPFIFRGALDVGATTINEAMKVACVHAIANLARAENSDVVASAYGGQSLHFGQNTSSRDPSTPTHRRDCAGRRQGGDGEQRRHQTDRRLGRLSRAVLQQFVFRSGLVMKPIFDAPGAIPGASSMRKARRSAFWAGGADRGR